MKEKEKLFDFAVGGQALMEGVLMRSPNFNVIAVRTPEGEIETEIEKYQVLVAKMKWLNIPIIRGVINMFEMLYIGTRALNYSSLISLGEKKAAKKMEKGGPIGWSIIVSMIVGLLLALFLFKFVPLWITSALSGIFPSLNENYLLFNSLDGVLKGLIFVSYIYLMTLSSDIRRVFMYHGAEHKAIMTYEHHLPLDVEHARQSSRFHPRCGTSFILLVFLVSIVIFSVIPRNPDFLLNFLSRLAALPLVAGVSYEILKISAKHPHNIFFRAVTLPGLWMQRLTTSEPDDKILEIGLTSLKMALQKENDYLKNHDVA